MLSWGIRGTVWMCWSGVLWSILHSESRRTGEGSPTVDGATSYLFTCTLHLKLDIFCIHQTPDKVILFRLCITLRYILLPRPLVLHTGRIKAVNPAWGIRPSRSLCYRAGGLSANSELVSFLLTFRIFKMSSGTWWRTPTTSRRRWAEAMAHLNLMTTTWRPVSKILYGWEFYRDRLLRLNFVSSSRPSFHLNGFCVHRAGCSGRRAPHGWRQLLPGRCCNGSFHPRGHPRRQVGQQGTEPF